MNAKYRKRATLTTLYLFLAVVVAIGVLGISQKLWFGGPPNLTPIGVAVTRIDPKKDDEPTISFHEASNGEPATITFSGHSVMHGGELLFHNVADSAIQCTAEGPTFIDGQQHFIAPDPLPVGTLPPYAAPEYVGHYVNIPLKKLADDHSKTTQIVCKIASGISQTNNLASKVLNVQYIQLKAGDAGNIGIVGGVIDPVIFDFSGLLDNVQSFTIHGGDDANKRDFPFDTAREVVGTKTVHVAWTDDAAANTRDVLILLVGTLLALFVTIVFEIVKVWL